jgi:hypothetical protein
MGKIVANLTINVISLKLTGLFVKPKKEGGFLLPSPPDFIFEMWI